MGFFSWLRGRKRRAKKEKSRPPRPKRIVLKRRAVRRRLHSTMVIAVANQKGGVGKTTTSLNMAAILAYMGHPVLLVDMDSQGHSTSGVGVEKDGLEITIFDLLVGDATAEEVIMKTSMKGLDVLPANMSLSKANIDLVNFTERELRLREGLDPVRDQYDFIFIDTPPSLGLLTINSLVCADHVLIPLQCEYFALEGVKDLLGIVKVVNENLNPDLKIEGILMTLFEPTPLSREISREVRSHFGDLVFRTVIPRDRKVAEAPSKGVPLILYDMFSPGCQAYIRATKELLAHQKAVQHMA